MADIYIGGKAYRIAIPSNRLSWEIEQVKKKVKAWRSMPSFKRTNLKVNIVSY